MEALAWRTEIDRSWAVATSSPGPLEKMEFCCSPWHLKVFLQIFALSSPSRLEQAVRLVCGFGLREVQGPLQLPGCAARYVEPQGADLGKFWLLEDGVACWVP